MQLAVEFRLIDDLKVYDRNSRKHSASQVGLLIACERLGMKARLAELDPLFVDVIVRRWQDYSGGIAVREGDGAAMPPK